MFENPETEKEGIRRACFADPQDFKKRGDETRERLRGSRVLARTRVQRGGETFVMPMLVAVVMHLLVRLRRSRQPQRHHETRERRADERGAEHSGMADDF